MKRFRYAFDSLCMSACALYAVNRFFLKPQVGAGFFHSYFNDVLVIPAALPFLLWSYRLFGWRRHDGAPTGREVAAHTVIWAVICEGIGPRVLARYGTGDWLDVVAYVAGAVVAWVYWNRGFLRGRVRATEVTL